MRAKVFSLIVVLCAVAAFFGLRHRDREPRYAGQSLTHWVLAYGAPLADFHPAHKKQAGEAIQQIGTNAIPLLLEWMRYNPPPSSGEPHAQLNRVLGRISDWLGTDRRWEIRNIARDRAEAAPLAFAALGPQASNALPALTALFAAPWNTPGANLAGKALASTPGIGLPLLAAALTNKDAFMRGRAAFSLEHAGTNAQPLTLPLAQLLTDPNDVVSDCAAQTLTSVHSDPDLVMPALTNALEQANPVYRVNAAKVLGSLGPAARPALAPLVNMLSDTNRNAHYEAAAALQDIAPETLTNAAVYAAAEKAFSSPYPHLRAWAAGAMHEFGPRALEQLPQLINCLTDQAPTVRAVALITIADLGHDARAAAPIVQRLLSDRIPLVRTRATNALLHIEPAALNNAPP